MYIYIPWGSKPILCLSFRKDRTLSWKAFLFPCGPWVKAGLFAPMPISTLTSENISLIEMKIEFQHFQPSQTQPYYSSQCLIHPGNWALSSRYMIANIAIHCCYECSFSTGQRKNMSRAQHPQWWNMRHSIGKQIHNAWQLPCSKNWVVEWTWAKD